MNHIVDKIRDGSVVSVEYIPTKASGATERTITRNRQSLIVYFLLSTPCTVWPHPAKTVYKGNFCPGQNLLFGKTNNCKITEIEKAWIEPFTECFYLQFVICGNCMTKKKIYLFLYLKNVPVPRILNHAWIPKRKDIQRLTTHTSLKLHLAKLITKVALESLGPIQNRKSISFLQLPRAGFLHGTTCIS